MSEPLGRPHRKKIDNVAASRDPHVRLMSGTQRPGKRVLRPRLPVNQTRRRPIRKRAVPRQEAGLIRVRGQSTDGVNLGRDLDRLTPEPNVLRAVD